MTRIILTADNPEDVQLVLALAKRLDIAVVVDQQIDPALDDATFWDLIAQIDLSSEAEEQGNELTSLIDSLTELPDAEILGFQDRLSEKLHSLDGQLYARHMGPEHAWREGHPFSSDHFLYARCYVVAKGKEFYTQVLEDPASMPKEETLEDLLYVVEDAWEAKHEESLEYDPTPSYETYSNAKGWEKDLTARLLNESIRAAEREPHGNSQKSMRPNHLYEIRDTKEDDVYKYGICGRQLNKDGSSKRANKQVRLFNRVVGWARFVAHVLIKNIPGRKAAEELEKEQIKEYSEKHGRPPRGNS